MSRITRVSESGRKAIQKHEKLMLKAYLCPAGVPSIGFGNTYYEDGRRVKLTDPPITRERAEALFLRTLSYFEKEVDGLTRDDLTQNQFDALVSFAYNVGVDALKRSTLIKKVNARAPYKDIQAQFLRWTRANGKIMAGLVARRKAEAELYGRA